MNWKRDIPQALIAVILLTIIEVFFQKGPYSIVGIFMYMACSMLVVLFLKFIYFSFRRSNPKNNQNENT